MLFSAVGEATELDADFAASVYVINKSRMDD